jgi:phosphoglycerate kinase
MTTDKTLKNIHGKYVLVRTGFDVPLAASGRVLDDTRIRAALGTIEFLQKKGARVILISHIGRDPEATLKPVYAALKKYLPVRFVPFVTGPEVEKAVGQMQNGEVVMLENLRSEPGEKGANKVFAMSLAKLADIYVNEAFLVSHRADASIVLIPKLLPSYAGIEFEREVKHLSLALAPKHPFLFILGGAKAETKLPLLAKYLKEADHVFVGGELANDFFKQKGYEIGTSKTDSDTPDLKAMLKNPKLILPDTVVVAGTNKKHRLVSIEAVGAHEAIFDVGLPSIDKLAALIGKAKLILWNGPMGYYEGGYTQATNELLALLASAKGTTIIGGGDTSVLVQKKKMADKFTFVSTAGGATLDFLAKGTLPGIKALK